MKITEIDAVLKNLEDSKLEEVLVQYETDERLGVQKIYAKYMRKVEKYNSEKQKWQDKLFFDEVFHHGEHILVGVDEVGRGPLAGPVVAAAVILPYSCTLIGLKDSKKLSEDRREILYTEIMKQAKGIGIGIVNAQCIDEINILQATFQAMRQALEDLGQGYDVVCVDGDKLIPGIECTQHAVIKGDDKSAAIAAASVIAKVTRDRMMKQYALDYPQYDWESNKGYGSQKHYEAIRTYGITELHRKSFLKNEEY